MVNKTLGPGMMMIKKDAIANAITSPIGGMPLI
jgi:hypothetical protein